MSINPSPQDDTAGPAGRRPYLPAVHRREQVLDAARRAFVSAGFNGATVRSIAADADIDQSMIFRLFGTKEQLFEEAIATPLQRAVNRTLELSLVPPGTADDDVRERATVFIRDLLHVMRDIMPLLGAVLTVDRDTGNHFYRERFEPALNEIRDVTIANLPLYPHRDFDPELVVRIFFGICWFLALDERYGTGINSEPDQLAPEIVNIILDGLVAREPPRAT